MAKGPDSSRQNVERILEEGVRDGQDRMALRNFLLSSSGGKGNAVYRSRALRTITAIKGILGVKLSQAERVMNELAEHREKGELSPYDFDLNALEQLAEHDLPLERKDMDHPTGPQAVVLTRATFDRLGPMEFVHTIPDLDRPTLRILPEQLAGGDVFVLYPWEVANLPAKEQKKEAELGKEDELKEVAADMLHALFADAETDDLPPNEAWNRILAVHGNTVFFAVNEGRTNGVPERYLRAYLRTRLLEKLEKKDYGFIARLLKNMKLADEAHVAFFETAASAVA